MKLFYFCYCMRYIAVLSEHLPDTTTDMHPFSLENTVFPIVEAISQNHCQFTLL